MINSSTIADQNQFYGDMNNLRHHNVERAKTNHPQVSFSSSVATNRPPSLMSQSVPWSHQTNTQVYRNISSQSRIQPKQSETINRNIPSSDINAREWQTINQNANVFTTSDSILAQALPKSLAAPAGWHSEVLEASSPIPNVTETNPINNNINNTNFIEQHENYNSLDTFDTDSILFSSPNEENRIVDEISSSSILPSTIVSRNSVNERINTPYSDCTSQEQRTILTNNQQAAAINVENRQLPPIVVHKTLPNNTVTYQQNVSVRYLQPPTPPPPGPIIIREILPPPQPPPSPVQIRQRAPPPPTPPPIVIRERPPPAPPRLPSQIVEKLLPPPPRPPRRMVVERYAPCPPKPADVVIERWLPYKRTDRRRILFERAPAQFMAPREPNLLILHDRPPARIQKEFINQGVVRADPQYYLQLYGAEINSWQANSQYSYLIDEATRTLPPPPPPPPQPIVSTSGYPYHPEYPTPYPTGHQSSPSPIIPSIWERMKSASSLPSATSYPYDYSRYNSPYPYPAQSFDGSHLNSYNDYPAQRGDMTPFWNRNSQPTLSRPYLPSYQFSSASSPYPSNTIQVNSDREFQNVLTNLTNGQVPSPLLSY